MNQPLMPQGQQPGRSLAQMIASLGPQSAVAATSQVDPRALSAGIKPSFASLTFKGKVWGIRHRGTTAQLLTRDPTTQQVISIPTVDVIIIKAAMAISKTYYIGKFKEGEAYSRPDCWSTNGQVPDAAAPNKQSITCRGCQWDAFGSRTMDDGRKGKACSDNKRLAVVPAGDIKNEAYGGPMLLRLPPSAFTALSELEMQLHAQGYHYYAVVMRCSFDHTVAFPKVMFTPVRVLNDHEMQEVIGLQSNELVDRILNEELFEVSADPQQPTPDQLARATQSQPQPAVVQPAVQPVVQQPVEQPAAPQATAFTPSMPPVEPPADAQIIIQPGAFGAGAAVPPQPVTQSDPVPLHPKGNGATAPESTTPVETAEQRIARLEAELMAMRDGAQSTTQRRATKRTKPVTPTGGQTIVQPPAPQATEQAVPFTQHAQPNEAEDEGDAPPDLDKRIDNLLKRDGA